MCFPALLPILSIGATVASTAIGVGATMAGANAAADARMRMGELEAQSYNLRADYADRQAEIEQTAGNYEAARQAKANDRALDNMKAQYLSSGIAVSGSPLDFITDSATEASLDEQAIRFGAELRSRNLGDQAQMSRFNAGQALEGGRIGALAERIQGRSSAARQIAGGIGNLANVTRIRNPYVF